MRIADMGREVAERRTDGFSFAAISAWVTPARMVTFFPDTLTPLSSGTCRRSMTSEGAASRSFIAGISVMPPETNLPSSAFFISFAASATEEARW
jgi:hypothetical protein